MNLQIALLLIGSVLIGLIYFVSRRYGGNGVIQKSESDDTYHEGFYDNFYENFDNLNDEHQEIELDSEAEELLEPESSINTPELDSDQFEELKYNLDHEEEAIEVLNEDSEMDFILESSWEIEPLTDLLEITDAFNTLDTEGKTIDWKSLTPVTDRDDDSEMVEAKVDKVMIVEDENVKADDERFYTALKQDDNEADMDVQSFNERDSIFDTSNQVRAEPILETHTDDEIFSPDYELEAQPRIQSEVKPNDYVLERNGNIQTLKDDDGLIEEPTNESAMFNYPSIEGFDRIRQIDYWVKISGARDIGRETVLAQFRESASKVGKPCRIYGVRLPDNSWCDLEMESEETRYLDIVVTVQLVDKQGPITESQLDRFTMLVSNLSEGTGRGFIFMAPVENALLQAQAVADFVSYYDSIFVINVRPQHDDFLDGGAILRSATQLGLEQSDDHFFVRNKSVGKKKICLYSLTNMTDTGQFDFEDLRGLKTRGVTFFTKPAVNRSPGAVFAEMVDTAKAFSARIKGEAVSPNHDDLSQDDIDDIRRSIEKVANEMEQLGMAPGSDEAMRVFELTP